MATYVNIPATASGGGFGADTTISLNNSGSNPVTALELVTSLTNTTPGAEASQWVVTLLSGGAPVTAMTIGPNQTKFPNGSSGAPGVAFAGSGGGGMFWDNANSRVGLAAGNQQMAWDGTILYVVNASAQILFSSSTDAGIKRNSSADLQIVTGHNVVAGADGALTTNATAGFLEIPSCPGTPTGTVTVRSGHVAIVYDSTNFKIGVTAGGGTWKQTAALT